MKRSAEIALLGGLPEGLGGTSLQCVTSSLCPPRQLRCHPSREGNVAQRGFGLMEVLVAAVVLGFLIVGLNILQKGNREAVLRIRARDVASIMAQQVLDSLSSIGINSLVEDENKLVMDTTCTYYFDGNLKSAIEYTIRVEILPENIDDVRSSTDSTLFTVANRDQPKTVVGENETNTFAKGLKATISWPFKKSTQSIRVARVVR